MENQENDQGMPPSAPSLNLHLDSSSGSALGPYAGLSPKKLKLLEQRLVAGASTDLRPVSVSDGFGVPTLGVSTTTLPVLDVKPETRNVVMEDIDQFPEDIDAEMEPRGGALGEVCVFSAHRKGFLLMFVLR